MVHTFRKLLPVTASFGPWIARAVRMKHEDPKEIATIGLILYQKFLFEREFIDAVRTYLDLCYTVDQVKIQTIGRSASTNVSNAIHMAIAYNLATNVVPSPSDFEWLRQIETGLEFNPDPNQNWGYPKIRILDVAIKAVSSTVEFAATVNATAPDSSFAGMVDEARSRSTEIRGEISGMMERLLELRRYGIKPAYFRASSVEPQGVAWVLWDHRDFGEVTSGWTWNRNQIAQVALAREKDLKDLRVKTEHLSRGSKAEMTRIELPFPSSFAWSMDREAEFDISLGLGAGSVREIFKRAGKELEYEIFRFHMWFRLYDLIVPIETVLQMPSEEVEGKSRVQKITDFVLRKPKSTIADLMLPRVRSLEDSSTLVSQLEREVEEAERVTQARSMRKHDVIPHIRRLPPGKKASPEARRLASEDFGIELADGETFVKKHTRGNLDPAINLHRARPRGGRNN